MGRDRGGKPTVLKLLEGARPNRINNDEPVPREGIPLCPSTNPKVHEVWDYTVNQLSAMRTITMADRDVLHAYCEQVIIFRNAMNRVERDGMMIEGSHGGWIKHPCLIIAREAAAMMRSLGTQFGLSPSSRTGITVGSSQPIRDLNDASRLLSG